MKTLDVRQGTHEWLVARTKYFTASEAPSMLGLSKYKSRDALLREKATGIVPEVDAATQRRFDAGHEAEAATRTWAEDYLGDDLYPITGTTEIEGLLLLASFDGITLDEHIVWETKSWNVEFAEQVGRSVIPDTHWPQLEQQLIVADADKVLFTVSDGMGAIEYCWYASQPERRARVIAGWKQFVADLAAYQHIETKPEAIGRAPEGLPALFVQVEGKVVSSNLPAFRAAAAEFLDRLPKELETDQDFADGEKAVKACKDAEDRLATVKAQAQSQAVTIDEVFRSIDAISEQIRAARLGLDKRVKAEKDNRRNEIVIAAKNALMEHVNALDARIGGKWMPFNWNTIFGDAIKGLKSIDSMRDKVSSALANAKIEASSIADRIEENLHRLDGTTSFLFPDFAQVCMKSPDDFDALVSKRYGDHLARQESERTRIRAEEQAKAFAEAKRKAQIEQDACDVETARQRALEQERVMLAVEQSTKAEKASQEAIAAAQQSIATDQTTQTETASPRYATPCEAESVAAPTDNGERMSLVNIRDRLGFALSGEFMVGLGFLPVEKHKASQLFRSCDFPAICTALIDHIVKVSL